MKKQNLEIMHRLLFIAILVAAGSLAGCRGTETGNAPIHLNLNMDFQQKFDPQDANAFFEDAEEMPGAAMRVPPAGAVARGRLRQSTAYYEGSVEGGGYVEEMPIPVTRTLIERGEDRYDVYCTVCHGRAGDGQGVIGRGDYGWVIPGYHTERLRQIEDGYIYDVIANGIRTMPGYAQQIPVADRWAIVAYVRALQQSQYAPEGELSPGEIEQARRSGNTDGGRTGGPGAGDTTAAAGGTSAAAHGTTAGEQN